MASVKFRQVPEITIAQVGTCGSVKVVNSNVGECRELVVAKKSACGCLAMANHNFGDHGAIPMAKVVK